MKKLLSILLSGYSCLIFCQSENKALVENYQKLAPDEAVRAILIDKQNYKWLGTDRGLYRMISMDHDAELMSSDSVAAITEDKKEMVWYGNRSQQLITEDKMLTIDLAIKGALIQCMAYYKGDIWVGTDKGLFRVSDDQSRILNHYTSKNSKLNKEGINSLYVDPKQRLWIGTEGGIVKIEDKDWDIYEKNSKFNGAISSTEGTWLLAEDRMWLVYEEDGRERWQDAAVKRGLSKGPVRALASDSKGRIYVASELLVQFDPYTDNTLLLDEDYGFVSSQTLSLACDKNDDLWVGTADRGLFRIDILDGEEEAFKVIAYSKGDIKCNGDKTASVIVIAKGGKTPYSYEWSDGVKKLTKRDSLGAGTFQITVTDAEAEEYVATVKIKEPEPIEVIVTSKSPVSAVNRKDGKATIEIRGGTGTHRILWSNGRSGLNNTNLAAGKQGVRIMDQNNCVHNYDLLIDQPKVIADLDRKKITVGQTLQINQLFFDADSAVINDRSFAVLNEIYDFLINNRDVVIEIGGHTNSIPPHEYCDRLSTTRAKNVADFLIEKGIVSSQVQYKGYGKRVPIASNDTAAGRLKNQRVELKIISMN
ncbi:MAG: OmpA family protein [Saprospiraceae bacterium]|nr:OmpA family protein [Saprospiraceae bacterium]